MIRRVRSWFASYGNVLAIRDVRLLFGGLLVSATGNWAYSTALVAFVYARTHSLAWVAAAGLVRMLPQLLVSSYAGVLVDRSDRLRLLVATNTLCLVWQCGLAVVALAHAPVALALVFAGLSSMSAASEMPAVSATVPTLVPEGELVAANALQSTIDNLVVIVGPAIGAVLLLAASAAVVFLVNAASFGVAAMLIMQIRQRSARVDVGEGDRPGVLAEMRVGINAIFGVRAVRVLVSLCALVSFVYGTDTILFVGISAQKLGTGVHGYGYLLAGLGIGGLLMAAAVDKLASRARLAWIILVGVAGYTLPTALMVAIHTPALAMIVQIWRGGSTLIVDVLALTALQRAVPRDQLGRVMGVFWAFIVGSIALGTVITPPIVNGLGLDAALVVFAVAPFALGLVGLPALLTVDRATATASALLAPKVALLEQLGFFASASRPLLERLATEAQESDYADGAAIITQGEEADYLYVLVEGSVEVTSIGEAGGAAQLIRTMEAPTYFGEIGILEHIARTANVSASGDCRCLLIEGDALLSAIQSATASPAMLARSASLLAVTHPSAEPEPAPVG